jgi:hypothetical protein
MGSMQQVSVATEVLSASLGGLLSASLLYPLEVIKTQLQSGEGHDGETMVEYAKRLYKEKGTGVFWEGVETSAIQSATEKALYFFAYTLLKNAHHSLTGTPHPSTTTNLGTYPILILMQFRISNLTHAAIYN